MTSARTSFRANFFEMNDFVNQALKRNRCALDKICLFFQTTCCSEPIKLSPTVQLDLRWTLNMSNQQNDQPQSQMTVSTIFNEWFSKH